MKLVLLFDQNRSALISRRIEIRALRLMRIIIKQMGVSNCKCTGSPLLLAFDPRLLHKAEETYSNEQRHQFEKLSSNQIGGT